jgi:hypothetical protein
MNKKYNKESGHKECGAARRICNRGNRCNRTSTAVVRPFPVLHSNCVFVGKALTLRAHSDVNVSGLDPLDDLLLVFGDGYTALNRALTYQRE